MTLITGAADTRSCVERGGRSHRRAEGTKPKDKVRRQNAVLLLLRRQRREAVSDVSARPEAARSLVRGRELVISELGELTWSKDGSRCSSDQEQVDEPASPTTRANATSGMEGRAGPVGADGAAAADGRATIRAALDAQTSKVTILPTTTCPPSR